MALKADYLQASMQLDMHALELVSTFLLEKCNLVSMAYPKLTWG